MIKRYPSIPNAFEMEGKIGKYISSRRFATDELAVLAGVSWNCYEKIDGMNIKIDFCATEENIGIAEIRGRDWSSVIPPALDDKLHEMFAPVKPTGLRSIFEGDVEAVLFGEGVGPCIGKHAGRYGPEDFVLFDVLVNGWWLKQHGDWSVDVIADALGLRRAPLVAVIDLQSAARHILMDEIATSFGDFRPEGVVCRPQVQLFDRHGRRIICKIKWENFSVEHRENPSLFF